MNTHGATRDEWQAFRQLADQDLLPVVSNPSARISPASSLVSIGKVPSRYNADGFVVGFPAWTSHIATEREIDRWQAEPAYGISLQTRDVRALDLDIEDAELAQQVRKHIESKLGRCLPTRRRAGSPRVACLVRVEGDVRKRTIRTRAGAIELLGDGQQVIVAGTHPSGARYEFEGGPPTEVPTITVDQFDALVATLESEFGTERPRNGAHTTSKGIEKGNRNNRLTSIAGFLVARGEPREVVAAALKGINATLVNPLPDREMDGIFKSACKWEAGTIDDAPATEDDFEDRGPAPQAPRLQGIVFRHIAEILADRKKPEWLERDILERGVLAILAGPRETFKSAVALNWALTIARSGRGVVVLNAEGAGLGRRIEAWLKADDQSTPIDGLHFVAYERAANLNDKDVISDLIQATRALPWSVDLIVVDTFSKYSAGIDENSNQEVALFLSRLAAVRDEFGCTILLVAHTGHSDKGRPRGASSLMANPDAEYIVSRDGRSMTVTVSRERFKDTPALPPLAYTATPVDIGRLDDDGQPVTSIYMRNTDAPIVHRVGKVKLNKYEKTFVEVLAELEEFDDSAIPLEAVLAAGRERIAHDPAKRDRRRDLLVRAANSLVDLHYINLDGDKVWISSHIRSTTNPTGIPPVGFRGNGQSNAKSHPTPPLSNERWDGGMAVAPNPERKPQYTDSRRENGVPKRPAGTGDCP